MASSMRTRAGYAGWLVSRGHSRRAMDAPTGASVAPSTSGSEPTIVATRDRPAMATATGRRSSRRSSVDRTARTVARTRSITGEPSKAATARAAAARAAADASNGTATRSPVQSQDATSSKDAPERTASTTSQPR